MVLDSLGKRRTFGLRDHREHRRRLISDYETRPIPKPEVREGILHGRVAHIDRFGNATTNVTLADVHSLQAVTKRTSISFAIGGVTINALKTHYEQGSKEQPEALINSNGYLEVFLKEASVAETFNLKTGTTLEIR